MHDFTPTIDQLSQHSVPLFYGKTFDEWHANPEPVAAPVVPERPRASTRSHAEFRGQTVTDINGVTWKVRQFNTHAPINTPVDESDIEPMLWLIADRVTDQPERSYRAAKAAADRLVAAGDGPADVLRILAFAIERAGEDR